MMDEHVGENAELYALGLLDAAEHAALEAHVATCDSCLRWVGAAEEAAAALASTLPRPSDAIVSSAKLKTSPAGLAFNPMGRLIPSIYQRSAGELLWQRLALFATLAAAMLVLFFATRLVVDRVQGQQMASAWLGDERILSRLTSSHFKHVSMTMRPGSVLYSAKVIYAPDGSWVMLLAEGCACKLRAIETIRGGWRDIGELKGGRVATLLLENAGRPEKVELTSGGTVEATANITYR
ncbi:MAG: zf-HC2 domain-containing protein [Candidatus Eremiobacteraeota bacterium]|nr:zf-HC2 domain-containing protein [Candidatus Eremiobacteraeota bacterium]